MKWADWDRLRCVLAQNIANREGELECGDVETASEALVVTIQGAMEASMLKSRRGGKSKPPWWNAELDDSKRKVSTFRRTQDWKGSGRTEYKRLRNDHLSKIKKAKWNSWREFASSANKDIWGGVYKWACNGTAPSRIPSAITRSDGSKTETAIETAESFLKELIPRDDEPITFDHIKVGRIDLDLTEEEVKQAVWRMAPNKAPGLDGITAGVLRKAWRVVGYILRG